MGQRIEILHCMTNESCFFRLQKGIKTMQKHRAGKKEVSTERTKLEGRVWEKEIYKWERKALSQKSLKLSSIQYD